MLFFTLSVTDRDLFQNAICWFLTPGQASFGKTYNKQDILFKFLFASHNMVIYEVFFKAFFLKYFLLLSYSNHIKANVNKDHFKDHFLVNFMQIS